MKKYKVYLIDECGDEFSYVVEASTNAEAVAKAEKLFADSSRVTYAERIA
jgi:hypothetical protein